MRSHPLFQVSELLRLVFFPAIARHVRRDADGTVAAGLQADAASQRIERPPVRLTRERPEPVCHLQTGMMADTLGELAKGGHGRAHAMVAIRSAKAESAGPATCARHSRTCRRAGNCGSRTRSGRFGALSRLDGPPPLRRPAELAVRISESGVDALAGAVADPEPGLGRLDREEPAQNQGDDRESRAFEHDRTSWNQDPSRVSPLNQNRFDLRQMRGSGPGRGRSWAIKDMTKKAGCSRSPAIPFRKTEPARAAAALPTERLP